MTLNSIDAAMKKGFLFGAVALALLACAKVEEPVSSSAPETDVAGLVVGKSVMAPTGTPTIVYAGFAGNPETRSRLELEEDGSEALVLWTRGDSFKVLHSISGGSGRVAYFTTQDDGVVSAAFTTAYSVNGTGFHCIYPNFSNWGTLNGGVIFGFNLPTVQTAVAGGIEEGLNCAYAYADQLTKTLDDPLQFRNIPSLLKFRLSGSIVPQVSEIILSASAGIAGDVVVSVADGLPELVDGISFDGGSSSSKVVLKGEFETGKDYYIALWPRMLSGFQLEFSDGNGSCTVKRSRKAVTFERSRIKDIGTIDLGDTFTEVAEENLEPIKYMSATEGTKPVTIAVIPEGFTMDELPLYEQLAKSGLDALFEVEPYKTYRNRFNAYILKVASRESGASISDGNGNVVTARDTYFGAHWGGSAYKDMQAEDRIVFDFVEEKCPDITDGTHRITEVPVLMIINDDRYGGKCWSYSDGKGYGMVPYTANGDGLMWSFPGIVPNTDDPLPTPVNNSVLNAYYRSTTQEDRDEVGGSNYGDWRNTLAHEFGGHCFGRLGDEYWGSTTLNYNGGAISEQSWQVPFAMNLASNPAATPWHDDLLANLEALVAADAHYGRIGVFQGGGTYLYGRWRSEKISCMIDNRFYFSAWQRYLIAKRIFTLSGDLDSFSFEGWLARDVTDDPVRDITGSSAPGSAKEHQTYTPVPPLPPPGLVEE